MNAHSPVTLQTFLPSRNAQPLIQFGGDIPCEGNLMNLLSYGIGDIAMRKPTE